MAEHVRNKHGIKHPNDLFHCTKCDFKTKFKQHLRSHKINNHMILNSEDLFSCNECSFQSKLKKNLVDHKRIHTIDLVCCRKCEYKTISTWRFTEHIRKVHADANEPFHCTKCEYKTTSKRCLCQHIKNVPMDSNFADTFSCNEINYQPISKQNFVQYKRKRTKDNLQCSECNFKTNYIVNLTRHVKNIHGNQDSNNLL